MFIWRKIVYFIDFFEIMFNFEYNVLFNCVFVEECGGRVEVVFLMWGGSEEEVDLRF